MKKSSGKFSASCKKISRKLSVGWRNFKKKTAKFFTPKRKKAILVISLNLLGMAAVAFLVPYITLRWIDSYTLHGEVREVPQVCGEKLEDAQSILAKNGLDYYVIEYRYKEGSEKNEVLEQYPRGPIDDENGKVNYKYVKPGRKIGLVLNSGEKPKQDIPQVIESSSYRAAVHRLVGDGFVIERVDTVEGDKDWVYGLICEGRELTNGAIVPRGSKLTIVIGGGDLIESPDTTIIDDSYFE